MCAGSKIIDPQMLQPCGEGDQPILPYLFLAGYPTARNRCSRHSQESFTVDTEHLVVCNLNFSLNEDDIVELFEKLAGPVKSVVLYHDRVTGAFAGKAKIIFRYQKAAREAFLADDASQIDCLELVVQRLKKPAFPKSEKQTNDMIALLASCPSTSPCAVIDIDQPEIKLTRFEDVTERSFFDDIGGHDDYPHFYVYVELELKPTFFKLIKRTVAHTWKKMKKCCSCIAFPFRRTSH